MVGVVEEGVGKREKIRESEWTPVLYNTYYFRKPIDLYV